MSLGAKPSAPVAAVTAEAERQLSLLAALWSTDAAAAASNLPCREGPVSVARGLSAYRTNAGANAARALEAAYPTVQALIGADDFRRLAQDHWLQAASGRGDLAEWGGALGCWLDTHPALVDWPYLGDCARLDWAVHRCECAADAVLDADSIARLGDTDPQRLHVELRPGVAVLRSRWPVAMLHEAHRQADLPSALASVRDALALGVGETALVARAVGGWRAQVHRIDAVTATWTEHLLAGASLTEALSAVGDPTEVTEGAVFDLATWLACALREGWLKGIRVDPD
ncbi:MAG: putative DNA-binding domain-containing protein [Burkholderiaceae bacterium]|nr:putative DNA-binding domain-containing protein [Burkholderiaceae bacterium]